MDFDLDPGQARRLGYLRELVAASGPPPHAYPVASVDQRLYARLVEDGFFGAPLATRGDHLMAALVVEELSRLAVVTPSCAAALVGPAVGVPVDTVVALTEDGDDDMVRFAPQAHAAIVLGAAVDHAVLTPGSVQEDDAAYVYPMGRVTLAERRALPGADVDRARRLWRLGLAAEMAGALVGGVDHVATHLRERQQFGRPLGSFQALQHRLAEAHVSAEAARWTARYAAWHHDNDEAVAVAATTACDAAHDLVIDLHQLCGARGFTLDFGLFKWTLRLEALRLELGGLASHASRVARARWRPQLRAGP